MARSLTTHERIARMYAHHEADRIPVIDYPWESTIKRWQQEGMPEKVDYVDYFDLDRVVGISGDNSPRYERISGRGLLVVEAVEALRPGVGTSGAISSETAPTGRARGRAWVVSLQARKIERSTRW